MPSRGDEANDILLNDAVKRALADGKCPACERGEKTIKPAATGILRSMTVHYPSGNICMASPEWKEMQETIRICKSPTPLLGKEALGHLADDMLTDESEIERLTRALESIAALPLGHHDAKKIASEALSNAAAPTPEKERGKP